MSVTISHKKMREIKEELSNVIHNKDLDDDNKEEELFLFLKDILRYKEDKTYKYDKEKYEKYIKPYYEKNKKEINDRRYKNFKQKKEEENLK
jgi:hypothetical protein